MSTEVDHLVVAAATLDEGVRWCEATLGLTPAAGGRHDFMGTHNRVLATSSACSRSYASASVRWTAWALDRTTRAAARPRITRWRD